MRGLYITLLACSGVILWVSLLGACIQSTSRARRERRARRARRARRDCRRTHDRISATRAAKAQAATDAVTRAATTLANAENSLTLNAALIIPGQDDPVPADKVHDWILTFTHHRPTLAFKHRTRCRICREKNGVGPDQHKPVEDFPKKSDESFPENRPEQFPENRPDKILEKRDNEFRKEIHQAFLAKMREQYPDEMRGLTGRKADQKAYELQLREIVGADFPEVSGRDPTNLGGCSDRGNGVANPDPGLDWSLDPDLEARLPRKYPPAKPENPVTRFNKAHSDKRCDRIDNHSRHEWADWKNSGGLGPNRTCPGVTNPAKYCKRTDAHGLHSWWSFDDNHEFTCPGTEPTPVRSVRPGTCGDKSVHQPHLWRVDNETRSYQCRGVLREVLPPAPKPVESHIDQAWQHYQDAVVDKGVNSPNASTAWGRFMKLRELEPASVAAEPVPTGGWVKCPHCNTTLRTGSDPA